ncbi:HlyC/CorC family transporter [Alkalicella caledoniensis]|uniref:HlyC/CorC family transporter n=1 Tax=Alkalicella caledoniensis TaxID=2731377 RepID=A0A7G9W7J9_ALKCA|nr:hemolysin family protein [Alkalicella caledoniensis]QNO14661.1 HlyC/CorC family transporter [Alkalicella caledoniensis]
MNEIPIAHLFLFTILILLSAYFSVTETSFSSVNKIRLKNSGEKGNKGAKKALGIAENFDEALSTILVGNNLANIAAATLSAQISTDIWGPKLGVIISTVGVTILVLVIGDILPKSLAKENAEFCSIKTAGSLALLMRICKPVTWIFIKIRVIASKLIRSKPNNESLTEEEIKVMVEISEQEGVIKKQDKELVHRSLELNDLVAGDIIIPRKDIIAADVNTNFDEITDIFFRENHPRIPVYEDNIDNIIGILSARVFYANLIKKEHHSIRPLLREPFYLPESEKVSEMLPKLQRHKKHMAIVTDEYGQTAGIITLDDILEKIVGKIWDDENGVSLQERTPNQFVKADYPLVSFVKDYDLIKPSTKYHTLGGWLTEMFGKVPKVGEEFNYQNIKLKIVKVDKKGIISIEILKKTGQNNSKS